MSGPVFTQTKDGKIVDMDNLVKKAVEHGGKLAPLVIPKGLTSGTGLMNPSVFVDGNDILVNLRHVNYTLVHSENNQMFPSRWGPLSYLHPEKDQRLVTENYLCKLDSNLEMVDFAHVEMLHLHTPIWEFVGLEDARLVKWDDTFYLIGVRRDTTTNGQGRMEYSKVDIDWNRSDQPKVFEVSRQRIPVPGTNETYCEKNWVPVLDKPYHFIKWTCPTELVYASPDKDNCYTVFTKQTPIPPKDQRGSSQVIRWGNSYISITHEVDLFKNYLNQKDAIYRHKLAVWDTNFNFIGLSKVFSFLEFPIEFCTGAAIYEEDLLISFGVADNAAFVLRTPKKIIEDLILEALDYEN